MTQAKPVSRTVDVELDAPYEGWTATMRADGISARILIDLQSGNVPKQIEAVASLIVSHNYLNESNEPATSLLDVPIDALTASITKWNDAVAALPPR